MTKQITILVLNIHSVRISIYCRCSRYAINISIIIQIPSDKLIVVAIQFIIIDHRHTYNLRIQTRLGIKQCSISIVEVRPSP